MRKGRKRGKIKKTKNKCTYIKVTNVTINPTSIITLNVNSQNAIKK